MLEDLSDELSDAIELAVEEARELGHGYVGTEHLLLALARQEVPATGAILAWHDLSRERLRARVVSALGSDALRPQTEMLPLTPAAKRHLELAGYAARHPGVRRVDPSHLLLAIIFDRNCLAGRILSDCEANLAEIRSQLLEAQSE